MPTSAELPPSLETKIDDLIGELHVNVIDYYGEAGEYLNRPDPPRPAGHETVPVASIVLTMDNKLLINGEHHVLMRSKGTSVSMRALGINYLFYKSLCDEPKFTFQDLAVVFQRAGLSYNAPYQACNWLGKSKLATLITEDDTVYVWPNRFNLRDYRSPKTILEAPTIAVLESGLNHSINHPVEINRASDLREARQRLWQIYRTAEQAVGDLDDMATLKAINAFFNKRPDLTEEVNQLTTAIGEYNTRQHIQQFNARQAIIDPEDRRQNLEAHPQASWRFGAACWGLDIKLFFPEDRRDPSISYALEICQGCSVKQECLDFAKGNKEIFGIWGGVLFNQFKKRPKKAKA